jgi:hypothetical protein
VHYNSTKPADVGALAYTQGTNIHVAPGQERHLPHEAWHVVQQAQGRVKPTTQLKEGVPINDDAKLENEANVLGSEAAHVKGETNNSRPVHLFGSLVQHADSEMDTEVAQTSAFFTADSFETCTTVGIVQMTPRPEDDRVNYVKGKLQTILRKAARGNVDPDILATDENINQLLKLLRINASKSDETERERWDKWVKRVLNRISKGAVHLAKSLKYWKTKIYPDDPKRYNISNVELTGSDLHEKGLGVAIVTFKPNDEGLLGGSDLSIIKVVIKPEDRALEKNLLGSEGTSLAQKINTICGLDVNRQIQTIVMETHSNYGSMIQFIEGQQAKEFHGHENDTNAMSEAIVFAFLTGLSDINKENVIWYHGKPYLIDADNALNKLQLEGPSGQSGFFSYSESRTNQDEKDLKSNLFAAADRSQIIRKLIANSGPLLEEIKLAFQGKEGRVVPIHTNKWAQPLNQYIGLKEGKEGSRKSEMTKWRYVSDVSKALSTGEDMGPGLRGEVGEATQ